jgi:hypothetical protein
MGRGAAAGAGAMAPTRGRSLALSRPPSQPSPAEQLRSCEDAEAAGDRVVLACR